jgi:thiol-disulfide isomerase/thioredoxin
VNKTAGLWLDVLAGVVAIVVVVGGCIAVHQIGLDFRGIYTLTAVMFFLAGIARGRGFAGNLWWKAARLSVGGFLGIAALIMDNGFHRLPVTLGLIPVAMAVSAAGVVARRDWPAARGRSLGVAGIMAALAAVVILAVVPRMSESSAFDAVDRPVPSFHVIAGDRSIGPAELHGRVTVLAFWASWCLPCIRELPELDRTYKRFADDSRVAFYAVDTGLLGNQTADDGRRFLERRRLSLPMAFDPGGASRALGVDGLPTLFILDRNGHVRYVHNGYDTSENLEAALAGLIEQLLQ